MHQFVDDHLIQILLGLLSAMSVVLSFFFRRLIKSFDRVETAVIDLKEAVIEHRTITDGHERRIVKIEDKVFK